MTTFTLRRVSAVPECGSPISRAPSPPRIESISSSLYNPISRDRLPPYPRAALLPAAYEEEEEDDDDSFSDEAIEALVDSLLEIVPDSDSAELTVPEDMVEGFLRTVSCGEAAADGGEGEICVICQDDLCKEDEWVGILECGHRFHEDCVVEWLRLKNVCPLCKGIGVAVFS